MKQTSFETFTELAQRSTFVPVVKELVADLLTPVSAFLRIAEHSDYAFLLESVEGGEHVGRYPFSERPVRHAPGCEGNHRRQGGRDHGDARES
jgi:anthranilate/para-aminobenzoate synthase component I